MAKPELDPALVRIAATLADGLPVDWDGLATERPELAEDLRELKFLERLLTAHREMEGEEQP